jgi:hypothetical protein
MTLSFRHGRHLTKVVGTNSSGIIHLDDVANSLSYRFIFKQIRDFMAVTCNKNTAW